VKKKIKMHLLSNEEYENIIVDKVSTMVVCNSNPKIGRFYAAYEKDEPFWYEVQMDLQILFTA